MMTLMKVIFKDMNLYRTNKGFRTMQIGTAALQSLHTGQMMHRRRWGLLPSR